jgi:hypothetical protein
MSNVYFADLIDMDAQTYYDSLIGQGYQAHDAQSYTQQHYPDFAGPAMAAAPAPVMEQPAPANIMMAQPSAYGTLEPPVEAKKRMIAPWVAVGVIVLSLVMPYISFMGFTVSGFEMIGYMGDAGEASGEDGGDMGDLGLIGIAIMLGMFSPVVYLLFAIISGVLLLLKKHPLIVGILHLVYFGLFMVCSVASSESFEGISIAVHDFAGIGFYMGSLAGIGLCLKV